MKSVICIILSITLLLSMTACGNTPVPNQQPATEKMDVQEIETATQPEQAQTEGHRILIAYFSVPEDRNTDGVDAIAGASIVLSNGEKLGNTEYVASLIQQTIGGSLHRIETVQEYPLDHDALLDFADEEQADDTRPELVNRIENPEQYDIIILGFPNWWADLPQPLYTFLESYDFSQKTIIPFVTHGGSGFSDTVNTIARLQPGAKISDNTLCLSRNAIMDCEETVAQWAESLGVQEETNMEDTLNRFPKELISIPEHYWGASDKPGQLQNLYYDTYESFSYAEKSQKLNKRAVVYLPYGYDETKEYPVFYLMHGGWSDETVYLGTPEKPWGMKNILDHGIANGEIQPMIVVCPTYNNLSPEDSGDYGLALRLTDNYRNELVGDLIPAVDSTYSTIADRDHRAFCGFSMGSMTTWRTFQYCLNEFRYFMPSSGGPAMSAGDYANIIKSSGYDWDDFFIFAASGTNDFAYSGFKRGIDTMAQTEPFRFADNEAEGNLYYLESDGDHSGEYAMLYFYNGLCWIWN